MKTSLEEIQKIVNAAFQVNVKIKEDTQRKSLPLWDSRSHITLIYELEDFYKVSFTIPEIEQIDSIKILREILEKKLA